MRAGMVGLASKYWPIAVASGLNARADAKLLGAATLGVPDDVIHLHLGMTPAEFAERFGVRVYRDAEAMIAEQRLDTVVLGTRHTEHAKYAEQMARLGMNVYIPKTFATTMRDAERIVRAQREHGVQIAVGPSDRFLPAMAAAAAAIRRGAIGQPFAIHLCHNHGTIDSFREGDWYREEKEGGPELSLGWYVLDLLLFFMPARVKSVFAQYANYTTPDIPFMDCGKVLVGLDNGAMASLDMYFCLRARYPTWTLEAIGPKGVITVHPAPDNPRTLSATLFSNKDPRPLPLPRRPVNREVAWVVDFKKKRSPVVSVGDALEITRLSLACRESARKGRPVKMSRTRSV